MVNLILELNACKFYAYTYYITFQIVDDFHAILGNREEKISTNTEEFFRKVVKTMPSEPEVWIFFFFFIKNSLFMRLFNIPEYACNNGIYN